jgi:hypothetical protein
MSTAARKRTPRLPLAATFAAAMLFAPAPATAQTVYLPAPSKPAPPPAWNCRAKAPVGPTEIRAARLLDATGARVRDTAGWTDVFTADKQAPLTVSIEWRSEAGPMTFADGMANFWVRNGQPLEWPLKMSLAGRSTIVFDAGRAYMSPREFSAYERIGKVLGAAGDAPALYWTLRGTVPGKGGMAVAGEGSYAVTELSAPSRRPLPPCWDSSTRCRPISRSSVAGYRVGGDDCGHLR